MAREIKLQPNRTYATRENAVTAVNKRYTEVDGLRYVVMCDDAGRFFPVFIGERAITEGVHFNFCVVN